METANTPEISSAAPPLLLLRAGPGAGKTQFVVEQARAALSGGSAARVLCLTLDTASAQGLEQRLVAAALADAPRVLPQVASYDQIARLILQEATPDATERFLDPLEERLLLGRAAEQTAATARHFRADEVRRSVRFRSEAADFIAELKRLKLTPELFREKIIPGLPETEALQDLAELYAAYQKTLTDANLYDLRGLLWLALMKLEDPALGASWQGRFDLILADDLQDATVQQLELLAALVGPRTGLAVAYEPAQTVYSFRGALGDPEPLLERLLPGRALRQAPPPAGPGALPQTVAAAAERFAAQYGLAGAPLGVGDRAGSLEYALFRSSAEEWAGLADQVVAALAAGECLPEEIAVLTRDQGEALAAAEYLALRGIPVAGEAGSPRLWQARRVLQDLLEVLAASRSHTVPPGARLAEQESLHEALGRLADLVAEPAEQLALPALCRAARRSLLRTDLDAAQFPALRALIAAVQEAATQEPLPALLAVARHLLAGLPTAQEALTGPLAALLVQMQHSDRRLCDLTGAALTLTELRLLLEESGLSAPFPAPAVSVLTAHQSRGRRFQLVFIAGLQEESFPAPARVSRLLAPATVAQLRRRVQQVRDLPAAVLSFAGLGEAPGEALAEEHRLFLTCLTRSSDRVVLSAPREAGGAPLLPSPYLTAVLPPDFELTAAEAPERSPQVLGEAPPARASLVPVLREVADQLVLSPTALHSYLVCPRRYFLEQLLAVAPEEEADNMTYGSAVHAFLREFNQLPPAERTAETGRVLLAATFDKRGARFSSPLAAALYLRLAEGALDLYLDTDLAGAELIALEQSLEFTLDAPDGRRHRFQGRIDAAVREGGQTAVVDYKTGKVESAAKLREHIPLSAEEVREGKAQVQLPCYALAWEANYDSRVGRVCLQNFSVKDGCKLSCVGLGDAPDQGTLTRGDLEQFRQMLVTWAAEIKSLPGFSGFAPAEGCLPFLSGCPFVGVCDEAEIA
ncbi:MAG TPA: PD-(D/E)XK nuclease family protein [Armatimonadota bacterium]|jgi:DNA helicase-2/ATP-dependent DNA helicase PcrA